VAKKGDEFQEPIDLENSEFDFLNEEEAEFEEDDILSDDEDGEDDDDDILSDDDEAGEDE
jgi:hypothetical protein